MIFMFLLQFTAVICSKINIYIVLTMEKLQSLSALYIPGIEMYPWLNLRDNQMLMARWKCSKTHLNAAISRSVKSSPNVPQKCASFLCCGVDGCSCQPFLRQKTSGYIVNIWDASCRSRRSRCYYLNTAVKYTYLPFNTWEISLSSILIQLLQCTSGSVWCIYFYQSAVYYFTCLHMWQEFGVSLKDKFVYMD